MNNCNCKSNSCNPAPSAVAVQTADGIGKLANTFVFVTSTNTVYYVSPCHEITIISTGPVFVNLYDPKANKLGLANQVCFDFAANQAYAFNATGEYRAIPLEELL